MTDSLLELGLQQHFILYPLLNRTDTGLALYGEALTITGRMSYKSELVLGPDGEQIQSNAKLTTTDPIKIGDKLLIDGQEWPVLNVQAPVDLSGKIHRRKAYI